MKTAESAVSFPARALVSGNLIEAPQGVFVLKPMLQWGARSNRKGRKTSLGVVWLSQIGKRRWSVSVRLKDSDGWTPVAVRQVDAFVWNKSVCHRLEASLDFSGRSEIEYRLLFDNQCVFSALAKFPIASDRQRVVLFGDFADGSDGAKQTAALAFALAPHMVLIPGDIVYKGGLLQEYQLNYDGLLNAANTGSDSAAGVPLARSTVVVAAAGNHDVRLPKQSDKVQPSSDEDLFAFFRVFRQPDNGPRISASRLSKMVGSNAEGLALLRCISPDFLRRANFALYQGEAQWVVLDANKYMDWRDPELQKWLRKTLRRGQKYKWRFVAFHQPGFSGDAKYKTDWRMRVLAPVFEEFGVQLVFSGHAHFYQRHRPISYVLSTDKSGRKRNPVGRVVVDEDFDGDANCRPRGVIYVVSGAGGSLQEPEMRPSNFEQEPYSFKICDDRNSLTVLDFDADSVTLRQLTADAQEVDRFMIRA